MSQCRKNTLDLVYTNVYVYVYASKKAWFLMIAAFL